MPFLKSTLLHLVSLLTLITPTLTACDAPSPAFPLPNFINHNSALTRTNHNIITSLTSIIAARDYDTTSFSIEITSQSHTLSKFHHSPRERSPLFDGGAEHVDGDTRYRIASMTKPFTVLALLKLQKEGVVNLDDPILRYLPELTEGQTGTLPWKDITVRALMSQQAGIPRDFAQDDLLNDPEMRRTLGLPDIDTEDLDLPTCDEFTNYTRSCNETDLLAYIKTLLPLFAPNQHSSYSNINYDILGLLIANLTNTTYDSHIHTSILTPLNLTHTTFHAPSNSVAAIAKGIEYYWPFYIGVQNPTGGLYSSSRDMSSWLRYILGHYNGITPALNWLAPSSFGATGQTFYGVPWEIYRSRVVDVLGDEGVGSQSGSRSTRPLTFVTKGGGLPGYSSQVILMPDYGLGITILVAGNGKALTEMREVLTKEVVAFAEVAAAQEIHGRYVGTYSTSTSISTSNQDSDSSTSKPSITITLSHTPQKGLHITHWLSNTTDIIAGLQSRFQATNDSLTLHVVPTLLYIDEKNQRGERWRVILGTERKEKSGSIWGNSCIGDWDFLGYAGKPVNEVVFWGGDGERVGKVELTGFRSVLGRVEEGMVSGGDGSQVVLEGTGFEG